MLGKVCLKRLRFVLYAVLFFLLTLDITNRTGDGLIATVCIWLALPLAFIAMVWWIYACVRDTVRLLRDGVAPEDAPTAFLRHSTSKIRATRSSETNPLSFPARYSS